jgi:hypothetical protein
MKSLTYFFILSLCILVSVQATETGSLDEFYRDKWKLTQKSYEYLKKSELLVDSTVTSTGKKQAMNIKIAGAHKKKCPKILRKLSMFDQYKNWVSFIHESKYSAENKLLTIKADHTLLPFPMIVHVIVDKPIKEGTYPFLFPTGIFTGLKGTMYIKQQKEYCAVYSEANWAGNKKIPDFVVELFSETLSKLAAKALLRKI